MLTMRGGGPQVTNGVKMGRPPPVPPRPDKSLVADALAKSRKIPAPVLPLSLKKEQTPEQDAQPPNKLPSPKLNGLSRVKSFIRDVMNDKKNSEDKKALDSAKTTPVKSHIPVSQSQQQLSKTKPKNPVSLNYPTEESVKNQSSQSVVRTLCSVLKNSSTDKAKSSPNENNPNDKARVVKSNSFADKPVPLRRAPPPPISPKPTRKQIEERLARTQTSPPFENGSLRKLSASCEELNNSSNRPIVYQSNKSQASPMVSRKITPPNLPISKPIISAKKPSNPSSPVTPVPVISDKCNGKSTNLSTECVTEKLISEIIAAKNDALLSQMSEKIVSPGKDDADLDAKSQPIVNGSSSSDDNESPSNCLSSYSAVSVTCPTDNISVCSSDGSAGKTVLFINSETYAETTNPLVSNHVLTKEFPVKRMNDIANHELLISELQDMRREAAEERVVKRQRRPSLEQGLSSPDSVSGEFQKIQHSDWVQVEDNGKQVRYSSCQIVIEDSLPVNDSGICLDDNFYSSDNLSLSLSPSLVSRLKEQFYTNQKMSSLQGLPPLPKSLSGFNVQDTDEAPPVPPAPPVPARGANTFRYACGTPPSPTTPGSTGGTLNGASSSSSGDVHRQPRKLTTLDTQLALLKREMVSNDSYSFIIKKKCIQGCSSSVRTELLTQLVQHVYNRFP